MQICYKPTQVQTGSKTGITKDSIQLLGYVCDSN